MDRSDVNPKWLCATCKHLHTPIAMPYPTCEAYPNGIPLEIQTGEIKHRKKHPGDNGIQYEKLEEPDE